MRLTNGRDHTEMRVEANGTRLSVMDVERLCAPSGMIGLWELRLSLYPGASNGTVAMRAAPIDDPMWPDVGWTPHPKYPGLERKMDPSGGGDMIRLAGGKTPTTEAEKRALAAATGTDGGTTAAQVIASTWGTAGGNTGSDGKVTAATAQQKAANDAANAGALKVLSTAPPLPAVLSVATGVNAAKASVAAMSVGPAVIPGLVQGPRVAAAASSSPQPGGSNAVAFVAAAGLLVLLGISFF